MPERKTMTIVKEIKDRDFGGYSLAEEETGLSRGTLYSMVCRKQIPHTRLGGRLVRFSRTALREWMKSKAITAEIEQHEGRSL
jgi:excisionase family DNA binding protein